MASLTKNLAPSFDSSYNYGPGERFVYSDHMYEVIESLSGDFDSDKVIEITLADIFKGMSSNDIACLAPTYDEASEYSTEDVVMYSGCLYKCVETTTGPFDDTKWSRIYLSELNDDSNSNLPKMVSLGSWNPASNSSFTADVSSYPNLTASDIYYKASMTLQGPNAGFAGYLNFLPSISNGKLTIKATHSGNSFVLGNSSIDVYAYVD